MNNIAVWYKQVGKRLRQRREYVGIGAEEAAHALHIPLEKYLDYESGRACIPAHHLPFLAMLYRIGLPHLLAETGHS